MLESETVAMAQETYLAERRPRSRVGGAVPRQTRAARRAPGWRGHPLPGALAGGGVEAPGPGMRGGGQAAASQGGAGP
eukprot:4124103-Lingulodinium_polyedra.AAC.1